MSIWKVTGVLHAFPGFVLGAVFALISALFYEGVARLIGGVQVGLERR